MQQESSNTKEKSNTLLGIVEAVKGCKKLLKSLVTTGSKKSDETATAVRELIQGLVDNITSIEEFKKAILRELQQDPQVIACGCLFLQKYLPELRWLMFHHKITIDGINPPAKIAYVSNAPDLGECNAVKLEDSRVTPSSAMSVQATTVFEGKPFFMDSFDFRSPGSEDHSYFAPVVVKPGNESEVFETMKARKYASASPVSNKELLHTMNPAPVSSRPIEEDVTNSVKSSTNEDVTNSVRSSTGEDVTNSVRSTTTVSALQGTPLNANKKNVSQATCSLGVKPSDAIISFVPETNDQHQRPQAVRTTVNACQTNIILPLEPKQEPHIPTIDSSKNRTNVPCTNELAPAQNDSCVHRNESLAPLVQEQHSFTQKEDKMNCQRKDLQTDGKHQQQVKHKSQQSNVDKLSSQVKAKTVPSVHTTGMATKETLHPASKVVEKQHKKKIPNQFSVAPSKPQAPGIFPLMNQFSVAPSKPLNHLNLSVAPSKPQAPGIFPLMNLKVVGTLVPAESSLPSKQRKRPSEVSVSACGPATHRLPTIVMGPSCSHKVSGHGQVKVLAEGSLQRGNSHKKAGNKCVQEVKVQPPNSCELKNTPSRICLAESEHSKEGEPSKKISGEIVNRDKPDGKDTQPIKNAELAQTYTHVNAGIPQKPSKSGSLGSANSDKKGHSDKEKKMAKNSHHHHASHSSKSKEHRVASGGSVGKNHSHHHKHHKSHTTALSGRKKTHRDVEINEEKGKKYQKTSKDRSRPTDGSSSGQEYKTNHKAPNPDLKHKHHKMESTQQRKEMFKLSREMVQKIDQQWKLLKKRKEDKLGHLANKEGSLQLSSHEFSEDEKLTARDAEHMDVSRAIHTDPGDCKETKTRKQKESNVTEVQPSPTSRQENVSPKQTSNFDTVSSPGRYDDSMANIPVQEVDAKIVQPLKTSPVKAGDLCHSTAEEILPSVLLSGSKQSYKKVLKLKSSCSLTESVTSGQDSNSSTGSETDNVKQVREQTKEMLLQLKMKSLGSPLTEESDSRRLDSQADSPRKLLDKTVRECKELPVNKVADNNESVVPPGNVSRPISCQSNGLVCSKETNIASPNRSSSELGAANNPRCRDPSLAAHLPRAVVLMRRMKLDSQYSYKVGKDGNMLKTTIKTRKKLAVKPKRKSYGRLVIFSDSSSDEEDIVKKSENMPEVNVLPQMNSENDTLKEKAPLVPNICSPMDTISSYGNVDATAEQVNKALSALDRNLEQEPRESEKFSVILEKEAEESIQEQEEIQENYQNETVVWPNLAQTPVKCQLQYETGSNAFSEGLLSDSATLDLDKTLVYPLDSNNNTPEEALMFTSDDNSDDSLAQFTETNSGYPRDRGNLSSSMEQEINEQHQVLQGAAMQLCLSS